VDVHEEGKSLVLDVELEGVAAEVGVGTGLGLSLSLLVALDHGHVRGLHSCEVVGRNDSYGENSSEADHSAVRGSLRDIELLLGILDLSVIVVDASEKFVLSLHKGVLGVLVVSHELVNINSVVAVLVTVLENDLNDLNTVLIIDALVPQKHVHFILVNSAIAVVVELLELAAQSDEFVLDLPSSTGTASHGSVRTAHVHGSSREV
jgi:hypothetical protein